MRNILTCKSFLNQKITRLMEWSLTDMFQSVGRTLVWLQIMYFLTDSAALMLNKFQWRFTRISTDFSSTGFFLVALIAKICQILNISWRLTYNIQACSVQCEGLKTLVCYWGSLACCKSQHHPGPERHLHASTCHQIFPHKDKIFFTMKKYNIPFRPTYLINQSLNQFLYKYKPH